MSEWHFMDPAVRPHIMEAWKRESEGMFGLAADSKRWEAPTRAGKWQVRDVVGHIIDTTETYFKSFDGARGKGSGPENMGLVVMAKTVNKGARSHRTLGRKAALNRLRKARDKMIGIAEGLTDSEWSGLMVPHKYMGMLPASFYPLFQVVDYGMHSWDIREGTGNAHGMDGDTADLLVPLAFILWQSTPSIPADTEPYTIGITVTGRNAGSWRISVSPAGLQVEEGGVEGLPAVIEFDPATLILAAYGRLNGGTVRGDRKLAEQFMNSFFRI